MNQRKILTPCLCGAGESEVQLTWHAKGVGGGLFGKYWHVECLRCGRRTKDDTIPQLAIIEWEAMVKLAEEGR